jgi:hypothetical protein
MWVSWHDNFWASHVHKSKWSESFQLHVYSLAYDGAVLGLIILTNWYIRTGLAMHEVIVTLLIDRNWLSFWWMRKPCWKRMKTCYRRHDILKNEYKVWGCKTCRFWLQIQHNLDSDFLLRFCNWLNNSHSYNSCWMRCLYVEHYLYYLLFCDSTHPSTLFSLLDRKRETFSHIENPESNT